MVTDFKHLNWFKKWVDDVLDHKIILDVNDPIIIDELRYIHSRASEYKFEEVWTPHYLKSTKELDEVMPEVYYIINFDLLNRFLDEDIKYGVYTEKQAQAIFEKFEGIVLVEFVPTSENLCTWFLKIIESKMKKLAEIEDFKVHSVEFWETPKSHCKVTKE